MVSFFGTIKYMYIKLISKLLQFLFNILFGPNRTQLKTNGCLRYDVIKDWKQMDFESSESGLFLLKFCGVKEISWLERGDVSLYSVEEGYFVFVRVDDKNGDMYDAEKHPFFYVVQHSRALELIKVRWEVIFDYLKGTGRYESTGEHVSYLHNIGRCGSTLVTNMVNKTRQRIVLSEPSPLISLVGLFRGHKWDISRGNDKLYDLVHSTLVLLTPDTTRQYFIKIHSMAMNIMPLIHVVQPGIRELFMYRALKPTANSFKRAFAKMAHFSWKESMLKTAFGETFEKVWAKHRRESTDHLRVCMLLCKINIYRADTADRDDIRAYRYEDLVKHKEIFCKRLLNDIGIVGDDFVKVALTALDTDSQKNSRLSKDNLGGRANIEISQDVLEYAKVLGSEFGIDIGGEDYQFTNIFSTVKFE